MKFPNGYPFGLEEQRVSLGLAVPKNKLSVISQKWTCGAQIYPCFQLVQPVPCKSSNGQQQMEWFLRQPAFIYVWRLPLVWVSTSHLHLNNPFAVWMVVQHITPPLSTRLPKALCLSAFGLCIFMVTINTIPHSRDTPTWLKGWPLSIENEVFSGNWKLKGVRVNCFSL